MAHDVGFVTNDGDASDLMRNAGAREFHRFQVTDHIALDSQTGSAVALPEPLQLSRSPGDFIREFSWCRRVSHGAVLPSACNHSL